MPTTNLASISARIRALLAKTTSNGCTEEEALSAAAKAQELLQTYQLSLTDLELQAEGTETLFTPADNKNIKALLANAIAFYTDCKVWSSKESSIKGIKYLGLRSDSDFAIWLTESLAIFVESAALEWLLEEGGEGYDVGVFVRGACERISERLREAKRGTSTGESRALVTTKNAIVERAFNELGITLRTQYYRAASGSEQAYQAGKTAGDNANFGRPVGRRTAGLLT